MQTLQHPFRTDHSLLPFRPDIHLGKKGILETLVQTSLYQTASDMAALYSLNPDAETFSLSLGLGIYRFPAKFDRDMEWVDFLFHCGDSLVLNRRSGKNFLNGILMNPDMKSGYVLPLFKKNTISDMVVLNSRVINHYGRKNCTDLCSLGRICSDLLY